MVKVLVKILASKVAAAAVGALPAVAVALAADAVGALVAGAVVALPAAAVALVADAAGALASAAAVGALPATTAAVGRTAAADTSVAGNGWSSWEEGVRCRLHGRRFLPELRRLG